jgi:hypothetical protein
MFIEKTLSPLKGALCFLWSDIVSILDRSQCHDEPTNTGQGVVAKG